jgi:hypothetical protein
LEKYGLSDYREHEARLSEMLTAKERAEWQNDEKLRLEATESLLHGMLGLFYGPGIYSDPEGFFGALRKLVRVGCFATDPNSVVMWTHYANRHTGICIEFLGEEILANSSILKLLHPVRYTDKRFDLMKFLMRSVRDLDELSSLSADIHNSWQIIAACQKSVEWQYEAEWRLVTLDPEARTQPKLQLGEKELDPAA